MRLEQQRQRKQRTSWNGADVGMSKASKAGYGKAGCGRYISVVCISAETGFHGNVAPSRVR